MKKLILCIIPLILLAMVFTVMPASAEGAESSTVLVSFDDGNGLACTAGSIAGVTSAEKTQGGGSLHIWDGGGNPGIMIFYNFAAKNLASYDYFAIDLWMPVGHNWGTIGINFTTDAAGQDGLNYYKTLKGNTGGGWFTVKMDKSEFQNAQNGAKWESITRVRIHWVDTYNNSSMTHILFDNLRGVKRSVSGTVAPTSISNGVGTISNCEAMDGWTDGLFNTEVGKSDYTKRNGTYSVVMKSKIPVGQNDQVGAMTRLNFSSAVNFSNACRFTFYILFDQTPPAYGQLQFNFITNGTEDGFNMLHSFNGTNYSPNTWHEFTLKANDFGGTNGANWSSIKAIRITWFNRDQKNVPLTIYIDDITASGHNSANGGTSSVHTKCSTCGKTLSTSHSYTKTTQTAATCTTKGTSKYTCGCGYSYTSQDIAINSSNHTGSSVNGGTSGVHTKYSCCGATISSSHSYTVDSGVQYSAATCTAPRYNYKRCSCGYNPKSSSHVVSTGGVNSSNHTGSVVNVGSASVHSKYNCCNATYSSSHSYTVDSGVQYSAATCTAPRYNYKRCSCGYNPKSSSHIVAYGSANGHSKASNWSSDGTNHWKECTVCSADLDKAAHTSTNGGTSGVHTKCSVCQKTLSSSHSYTVDSGVQYSAATCTAPRYNYKKCSCGYNPQSSSHVVAYGSANGHSYGDPSYTWATNYSTCTGTRTCSVCSNKDTVTVNSSSAQSVAPTCTTKGKTKYTATFSSPFATQTKEVENIAALGHDFTKKDTSATYLKSEATCTDLAVYYYRCSRCTEKGTSTYTSGSVNASNHTGKVVFVGSEAIHSKYDCCDATVSTKHTYSSSIKTPATCTVKGTTTYTCECGYSYDAQDIAINPDNHTGKVVFVGSEAIHSKYDCCNATVSTVHSYTTSVEIEATCTEMGTTRYTCECGYTYTAKDIAIDPANHTGEVVFVGSEAIHSKYDCCNATVSTVHSYTTSVEIEATCTEMGTTRYTCECGYTYTAKDVDIDPNNHVGGTEVRGDYAEDCGNDGYTGDIWCLDCETIIEEGQVIPATGAHTGGEATCISKAVCDVCSQEYGEFDDNNHKHTEIRDETIIYSGDTWCTDCNKIVVVGHRIAYYGDVNNDNAVDAVDAMILAKYIIGLDVTVDFNDSTTKTLADVDGDGMLTSIDTMLIIQFDVDLIEKFPVEQ